MTKAFRDWLQAAREASGRGAAAGGLASAHAAIADRKRRRVVGDLCELAGLYVELLQDSEQARSCLDEALDLADNVGDLVTLAGAHAEQPGGKRIAGGLVDRALELARTSRAGVGSELDVHGFWSIAGLQRYTLSDPARAKATLTTGLELCDSVDEVLIIVRAWHAVFSMGEGFRRALDAARGLATDSGHWVAIAEAGFDLAHSDGARCLRQERSMIQDALERGLAVASTDAERAAVATGFRALLDDAERADGITPSGLLAGEIVQPLWTLEGWGADPARLLGLLRPRVNRPMLRTLAQADYGSDEPRHLSALVAIWESGRVPFPLPWHPREVLELVRWDEGDDTDHVRRAFACAVLCIDAAGPEYSDGTGETLVTLLESCLALGREFVESFAELVVALVEGQEDYDERVLFGLFALLLAQAWLDPSDPRLPGLAVRLEALESEHAADGYARPEEGWLLGTTNFNQRHELWRRLSSRVLGSESAAGLEHLGRVHARLVGARKG
jgi:hypothetical protein